MSEVQLKRQHHHGGTSWLQAQPTPAPGWAAPLTVCCQAGTGYLLPGKEKVLFAKRGRCTRKRCHRFLHDAAASTVATRHTCDWVFQPVASTEVTAVWLLVLPP